MHMINMMMVGVPGSGKSTWIKDKLNDGLLDPDKDVIVSIDDLIEEAALALGKTYDDIWDKHVNIAAGAADAKAREAFADKKNVIWDMTNTTAKSRKRKMNMAPEGYMQVAVVFPLMNVDVLLPRLNRPGKTIPPKVLYDMIDRFSLPTFDEGFHTIQVV